MIILYKVTYVFIYIIPLDFREKSQKDDKTSSILKKTQLLLILLCTNKEFLAYEISFDTF